MTGLPDLMVALSLGFFGSAALLGALERGCGAVARVAQWLLAAASASLLSFAVYALLVGGAEVRIAGLVLEVGSLQALVLLMVSASSLATSVFMAGSSRRGCGSLALIASGFMASMALAVLSTDLLTFLFFWEFMVASSLLMILWWGEERSYTNALKYAVSMHILSSVPLIIATALAASISPGLGFSEVSAALSTAPEGLRALIAFLAYAGFAAKAGLFPLQFWMPGAYTSMPDEGGALMSGAMIKVGFYGIIRIVYGVMAAPAWVFHLMLAQALLTIVWSGLRALREGDVRAVLAYSSSSQSGYISAAIAIAALAGYAGSPYSSVVMAAALTYMLAHSLVKTSLFLLSGTYRHVAGSTEVDAIYGAALVSRAVAASAVAAVLAIAGLPPTLGFIAKLGVIGSLLGVGDAAAVVASLILLAASPLTLLYVLRVTAPALTVSEVRGRVPAAVAASVLGPAAALVVLGSLNSLGAVLWVRWGSPLDVRDALEMVMPPVVYYVPFVVGAAVLASLIIYVADSRSDVTVARGPWTTGYSVPLDRFRVSASRMYTEVVEALSPLYRLGDEVGGCVTERIPGRLSSSGIATGVGRFFDGLGRWAASRLVGFGRAYSGLREFKLDEAAGSSLAFIVRSVRSFLRVLAVSPIGLFAAAMVFLAILAAVILMLVGGG